MNNVPFAFYDAVTRQYWTTFLPACRNLQGLIGVVAAKTHEKLGYEDITIDCRIPLQTIEYKHWYTRNAVPSINPAYRICTVFLIHHTDDDHSTDTDACNALMAHANTPSVCLYFYSSTIGKKLEESIDSLRFVSVLYFSTKSVDLIPRIMRKFVPRKTITRLKFSFDLDYVFNKATATLLLDLLKQEQFCKATLPPKSNLIIKKIIADWKENSEKFVGKKVYRGMKVDNPYYRNEIKKGNIRVCTKAERHFQNRYYPRTKGIKRISTNQKGGVIYWAEYNTQDIQLFFG